MSKIRGKIASVRLIVVEQHPLIFPYCSFWQQRPLPAGVHVLAQPWQPSAACLGYCRMLVGELQMKLQWRHAWCSLHSSPQPFPCLVWGSGGCAGVLLGAPSLVGHWEGAVDAQSDLTRTELGQGPGASFTAAKRAPDSCPCTLSPSEPPARWGSPQVLLGCGGSLMPFCLSCQWRTQHTVSSPTCGTSSSGQCPVPRAFGHQLASRERGQPSTAGRSCCFALLLHPCLPSRPAATLQPLCKGWPHSLGTEFRGERSSGGVRTHSRIAGSVAPAHLQAAFCLSAPSPVPDLTPSSKTSPFTGVLLWGLGDDLLETSVPALGQREAEPPGLVREEAWGSPQSGCKVNSGHSRVVWGYKTSPQD